MEIRKSTYKCNTNNTRFVILSIFIIILHRTWSCSMICYHHFTTVFSSAVQIKEVTTKFSWIELLDQKQHLKMFYFGVGASLKTSQNISVPATNSPCIQTLHRWTDLLASAIAGLSVGGDGGSWCSAAGALSCAVVAQDFSLVSFLPHRRRIRLADSAAWFQTQRHR